MGMRSHEVTRPCQLYDANRTLATGGSTTNSSTESAREKPPVDDQDNEPASSCVSVTAGAPPEATLRGGRPPG